MEKLTKLEFKNVSKDYGNKVALNDFNISLEPGIYGLLGPNGAGKSTLMNLITDNIKRTSGEILYNGKEILTLGKDYRTKIGYMPQQQGMYDTFSAEKYLFYIAALKGITKKEASKEIDKYLKLLNLHDVRKRKLGQYSGGMRQRLQFISALIGNPDILILDEPTAGVDPEERIKMRNYISELSKDKLVLLATHIVSDIECIASKVLLLKDGKLIKSSTSYELIESIEDKMFEKKVEKKELNQGFLENKRANVSQRKDGIYLSVVGDTPPEGFVKSKSLGTLEDVYMYYFS